MKNKLIIITGATSGLGLYSALDLLNQGAKVIFCSRDEKKAKESMRLVNDKNKENATFIQLDLCDFDSINKFIRKIKENYPKIDILINNAGAQPQTYSLTKDGFEKYLEGNYLGHVLLTQGLLDHFNNEAKIINLVSIMHFYNDFSEKDLNIFDNNGIIKKKYFSSLYGPFNYYGTLKLFLVYYTQYLSRYLEEKSLSIKVACVHPGIVHTNYTRFVEQYKLIYILFIIFNPFWKFFSKSTESGAQTQLYLCYLKYNEFISGGYYADCKISNTALQAKNKELEKSVIDKTMNILKNKNNNKNFE